VPAGEESAPVATRSRTTNETAARDRIQQLTAESLSYQHVDEVLNPYEVSLYLHVSLFFGIVKIGYTTRRGGPREQGQHVKVYFPCAHKAAFGFVVFCRNAREAVVKTKMYETLAFRLLSVFVLQGEVFHFKRVPLFSGINSKVCISLTLMFLMQLLKLYLCVEGVEECMLLLFKGVLEYVTSLTHREVIKLFHRLPQGMSPTAVRELLASLHWTAHGVEAAYERNFAQGMSYISLLPVGDQIMSRSQATGVSFSALWNYATNLAPGSLRNRVEHEGFTYVVRVTQDG